MEWYEKAEANEIPMAMLRMGEYYLYDYDSLNESEKAFAYFKKAAEYEWYSEGLGICYETVSYTHLEQQQADYRKNTSIYFDDFGLLLDQIK